MSVVQKCKNFFLHQILHTPLVSSSSKVRSGGLSLNEIYTSPKRSKIILAGGPPTLALLKKLPSSPFFLSILALVSYLCWQRQTKTAETVVWDIQIKKIIDTKKVMCKKNVKNISRTCLQQPQAPPLTGVDPTQ